MKIASLLLFTALAGCAAPVRLYDGPAREARAVAHIRPHDIMIHSVDGTELDPDARVERRMIEVLPGERVVRVEWSRAPSAPTHLRSHPRAGAGHYGATRTGVLDRVRRYYAVIEFTANAGHVYEGVWVVPEGAPEGSARQPALRDVTGAR